jgi:hypothetical protein
MREAGRNAFRTVPDAHRSPLKHTEPCIRGGFDVVWGFGSAVLPNKYGSGAPKAFAPERCQDPEAWSSYPSTPCPTVFGRELTVERLQAGWSAAVLAEQGDLELVAQK